MKTLLTGILIFLIGQTYAQDAYAQNYDAPGFTEKQRLQFEKKVEEHLINEKKIRTSQLSINEKIVALKENYLAETNGMNAILTQP